MADMQIVLACKNVEAQYVEMMVPLYSYGCGKKIKNTLSHLKGNINYRISYISIYMIICIFLKKKLKNLLFCFFEHLAYSYT
jgi:hypothetical protein